MEYLFGADRFLYHYRQPKIPETKGTKKPKANKKRSSFGWEKQLLPVGEAAAYLKTS